MENFVTGTGQHLKVHPRGKCQGEHCPMHNPSPEAESIGRTHWRYDRQIMERICEHGVGHPDPDDFKILNGSDSGIHGCDGCCVRKGE